ncbi:MAG: dephospho-CoA kinase [Gemmataceae bacterium]
MGKPVIGIVGGIGSGKSFVAAEFARRGGRLISADPLGHDALRQPHLRDRVVERWGRKVLDATGDVDRRALGRIVFPDPKELRALEAITYPYIEQRVAEEIAKAEADPAVRFVILDAAVMLEAGWSNRCDHIVFIDAPREVRLARLIQTRGWTEAELARREANQMPLDEKRRHADGLIQNGGDGEGIRSQVERLLRQWKVL